MFARRACYFFVRPKRAWLEVCIFLDRALKEPQVRRAESASRTRVANMLRVTHRDEVEAPITDWLREAYELVGESETRAKGPSESAPPVARPVAPARARGAKKR